MSNPLNSEQVDNAIRAIIERPPVRRWYARGSRSCQCRICVKVRTELNWDELLQQLSGPGLLDAQTRMWLVARSQAVCDLCHSPSPYRKCVPYIPPVVKAF